jgi:hypothetical protein
LTTGAFYRGHLWGEEREMSYSITLRSRTDARITGWCDGSTSRWSTDHTRQKLDSKHEAKLVRDELRRLCPRNAEVINVEPARVEEKALADLETV